MENLPDPDVFGITCTELRTCGICGEEIMGGAATDDHWEETHGIDFLVLKKLSLSDQVKKWNKALEDYENCIEPGTNRSLSLDYSESKSRSSVSGTNSLDITAPLDRDVETKLSSFESKLNAISVTVKQLASTSAACADKIAAIPDLSLIHI